MGSIDGCLIVEVHNLILIREDCSAIANPGVDGVELRYNC
jgi:hypothetical protein